MIIHDSSTLARRDLRAAFAAAYFGGDPNTDDAAVTDLVKASVPVIPTIEDGCSFELEIPRILQPSNGHRHRPDDPTYSELAAALLECAGLLRKQRRVFVSYRRVESRAAAMQLHDQLTARGFDVFLDTHDIRPGEPFQDVLWHRLCDADVLLMLDTPTYFGSKWTRHEIGRARAKDIHVLRVVWPDHTPSRLTDMAETVFLNSGDLAGPDGPIEPATADRIILAVERLRSRSIASRYMAITGKLRADVEKIGGSVTGVGSHRAIAIKLLDDRRLWAYPVVGIPTAELLHDVADKASRAVQGETPILVYDHVGMSEAWMIHLRWLDDNISSVRAIKTSEAGWRLAAWEG